ncbi:MAG: DUF2993 domain-containing protein [Mycobacteriales bacterium]
MKGLLAALVAVLVLLVAADRIAVVIAERAVASQLETAGRLSSRPDVSVRGFPFLTQALAGRYDDVEVAANEVTAGGGLISRLTASLHGVHVAAREALAGTVTSVPVDRLDATVLLSYADIGRQLRDRNLTLAPAGNQLKVTGAVQILGQTLSASALSTVRVSGTSVVVTATQFLVGNKTADRLVTAALGNRLDFVVAVGRLPYGLRLSGVRVEPQGVLATASATGAVLHR